jgi:hypothetical protein
MRIFTLLALGISLTSLADSPLQVSGIYPHLAMFNKEGECGTGAVVPWADRLWVITYGPHLPFGSSDKLYEITPSLEQIIRPESVGGTPANRMIHKESQQLIDPYLIDAERKLRVLPPSVMPGRLTANARHLSQPAEKAYYATMEEALYEVDLHTLEVTTHIRDGNGPQKGKNAHKTKPTGVSSKLPGYHGKGLYSGQGRVIYANNGDRDPRVITDPATPSGALGEWKSSGQDWALVRRNQFTEVTGPGGIYGNSEPATDPVWSVGWDQRSLILMCLHGGQWHSYRLPKSSHSYDGAHGWNTEWPRIRDVGQKSLLMTMHGAFWHFPSGFTPTSSSGISPRSNYMKVIGDFCSWQGRIVLGCDDSAQKEFLNKRKAKGELAGPGESQSNLWFIQPETLDALGPVIGRGAVWLEDKVKAGQASEPFLFSGYQHRMLYLLAPANSRFIAEVDVAGSGKWQTLQELSVADSGLVTIEFTPEQSGAWIRLVAQQDGEGVTAQFHYRNNDTRPAASADIFSGLATAEDSALSGGVMLARGAGYQTLRYLSSTSAKNKPSCYDVDAKLQFQPVEDTNGAAWVAKNAAIPAGVLSYDAASILYTDEKGTWRLPRGDAALDQTGPLGAERVCREVCTERDLFNAGGTFFELPAENAGGFAKVRPVTTHNRRLKDYASYRGLFLMSGVKADAKGEHIVRSADGKAALWVGAVDDMWQMGKPRGKGGPWLNTPAKAGQPSHPYLCSGYDKKELSLSSDVTTTVKVEVDITGTGLWVTYRSFDLTAGQSLKHDFSPAFGGYWLRCTSSADATVSAQCVYE